NGVVAPHHSRFARADRKRLDAAVEAAFGKHRVSGVGRVLVATQTVEQSLDLDPKWKCWKMLQGFKTRHYL
ncbi:MAG TPA: hypothetical protein VLB84_10075, partial [Bacteroidia bacterium]|nr:hypothetical protein [Bacteroidia bacterium]